MKDMQGSIVCTCSCPPWPPGPVCWPAWPSPPLGWPDTGGEGWGDGWRWHLYVGHFPGGGLPHPGQVTLVLSRGLPPAGGGWQQEHPEEEEVEQEQQQKEQRKEAEGEEGKRKN